MKNLQDGWSVWPFFSFQGTWTDWHHSLYRTKWQGWLIYLEEEKIVKIYNHYQIYFISEISVLPLKQAKSPPFGTSSPPQASQAGTTRLHPPSKNTHISAFSHICDHGHDIFQHIDTLLPINVRIYPKQAIQKKTRKNKVIYISNCKAKIKQPILRSQQKYKKKTKSATTLTVWHSKNVRLFKSLVQNKKDK